MKKKITGKGGLVAYLGTNNAVEVENAHCWRAKGKANVRCYGIPNSKRNSACARSTCGKVDAIILTGGIAYGNQWWMQ